MYYFDADFFKHVYYINSYLLNINPGLCIDILSYIYMVLLIDECFYSNYLMSATKNAVLQGKYLWTPLDRVLANIYKVDFPKLAIIKCFLVYCIRASTI